MHKTIEVLFKKGQVDKAYNFITDLSVYVSQNSSIFNTHIFLCVMNGVVFKIGTESFNDLVGLVLKSLKNVKNWKHAYMSILYSIILRKMYF